MATKKECDRCGEQVSASATYDWHQVSVASLQHSGNDDLTVFRELCTSCTRQLNEFMKRLPTEAKRG